MKDEPKWSLWFGWISVVVVSVMLIWIPFNDWHSGNASLGWRETKALIVTSELVHVADRSGAHKVLVVRYLYSDSPLWSPQQLTRSPNKTVVTGDLVGLDGQTHATLERFCDGTGDTIAYERQLGLRLYCGSRIAYGGEPADPISVLKYIPGRVVTVYTDPLEPRSATIERGWQGLSAGELSAALFSGLILLVIVIYVVYLRLRQNSA